jgi:hypothetical protein
MNTGILGLKASALSYRGAPIVHVLRTVQESEQEADTILHGLTDGKANETETQENYVMLNGDSEVRMAGEDEDAGDLRRYLLFWLPQSVHRFS